MTSLYPEVEPYDSGLLNVGDSNLVYWQTFGNPYGKPAVVIHGGPGSGCSPAYSRFFNPKIFKIVLFDQRNCGRSRPHASDPACDLTANNTNKLIADIELLRRRLRIERWLVLGGSWGSTLSLAYAERHPERVTAMVLFGVTTGRVSEVNWAFRGGLATFFPEQWHRLEEAVPPTLRGGNIVDAYAHMLSDPDREVRRRAAEEWCMWESATPHWPPRNGLDDRFKEADYAVAFARIVTHYVRHDLWLEDGILLRDAHVISKTPGILVNGRFDFQAPISNAWALKQVWSKAELVIVNEAGHADSKVGVELVRATDSFASA